MRAAAFALLGKLLGADVTALVDDETVDSLRRALDDAGDVGALERLSGLEAHGAVDVDELAGTWVRWFDLGRVAAYEGSNVPGTAGGVTPRLADIAGFYSAFGLKVSGDRPDHIVAELEPWLPVAAAAAELVAAECRDRNVVPLRLSPALPADRGVAPPDEAALSC